MRGNRSLHLVAVLGLVTAGLGAGRLVPTVAPPATEDALAVARTLSSAYQRLAKRVGPAVVLVKTYRSQNGRRRNVQDGSGVIVRRDGVIVTNDHVVRSAEEFVVVLTDGRRLPARMVGTDRDTDLAVLKVDADGLVHAPLDADVQASVGEIVLAMGNPLGLGHTVTSGIVSGLGRTDLNVAFYEDFIQTDAAINPGNSGGPLINLEGEVLGINTAVGMARNGDAGIAFAIPSHMVRRVMDDLLRYGVVKRGFLGVTNYRWGAERRLRQAHLDGYEGVSSIIVQEVELGTPADRAGLEENDIILSIHGLRITDQKSFRTAIADVPPGARTTVRVWRDGEQLALPVTVTLRE